MFLPQSVDLNRCTNTSVTTLQINQNKDIIMRRPKRLFKKNVVKTVSVLTLMDKQSDLVRHN